MHTAVVLGAGLVLAELARTGALPRPVRLLFQPAEEVLPGGAPDAIESGALEGVGRILAVHCDPRVDSQAGSGSVRERSPRPATGWRSSWTAPEATPPART